VTFDYPAAREHRRHGPHGYKNYEKYRPWLRDEFSFRCVYCLWRERWSLARGAFHIDHFAPQSLQPDTACDYENLVYACHSCNLGKSDRNIPDPFTTMTASRVRTLPDGTIEGLDSESRALVAAMNLNDRGYVAQRIRMMRIIDLSRNDPAALEMELGFPDDLPDLHRRKPPGNTRPEGIAECFHARAKRGELPELY